MRERWRDMFLMEEQICFSSDGWLFTWWPRANKDFPDEWVDGAVGHNTPTPSYISQADGIRSDGCPKECGPRDTMLIPHKKRRKTRSSAIPKARSTAVHGSACCALIEAPTRVAPPLGGKNTTWGQKKVPASTLKKDLGKQKRKCCGKKVSFAPQKIWFVGPLTGSPGQATWCPSNEWDTIASWNLHECWQQKDKKLPKMFDKHHLVQNIHCFCWCPCELVVSGSWKSWVSRKLRKGWKIRRGKFPIFCRKVSTGVAVGEIW